MVMEIFYAQPSIIDRSAAHALPEHCKGDVEFRNVSFQIDGNVILDDISFHIKPGQTLGIMGPTGSGKTSVVNMLERFYEPTSGEVLLDGENIQNMYLSDLHRTVNPAMQDVFLFSDTVEGNIAYGAENISFEDVQKFARIADADGFIKKMEEGYDTLIGERGVGLSGGQRQRISLARALAMQPSVLVLDDTTSAVDMETEQYIQDQLRHLDFLCTKVIIAQRISSVQDADWIIILDEGKIREQGTHAQLLENHDYYYHIWALQNNVDEGGDDVGA